MIDYNYCRQCVAVTTVTDVSTPRFLDVSLVSMQYSLVPTTATVRSVVLFPATYRASRHVDAAFVMELLFTFYRKRVRSFFTTRTPRTRLRTTWTGGLFLSHRVWSCSSSRRCKVCIVPQESIDETVWNIKSCACDFHLGNAGFQFSHVATNWLASCWVLLFRAEPVTHLWLVALGM